MPVFESGLYHLPGDFACFGVATLCEKLTFQTVHLLSGDELVSL